MKILLACLLCVILIESIRAYENDLGLLESKMNRRSRFRFDLKGSPSLRTTEISEDETTFKYSLLSIQINEKHICTGTPIGVEYGFTTANCAIKVKMNLPDLHGHKVRVHYSDTLEPNGPWVPVKGVSIKREPIMFTLDETYENRRYDYGFIQFYGCCEEMYTTTIMHESISYSELLKGGELHYIVWTPSRPREGEGTIVYTGPPKSIKGVLLEDNEVDISYQTLKEFPSNSIFVSRESLSKGNIGTPVIQNKKLVGIIAHVDEGGSAAVMVELSVDVTLNPLDTHHWSPFYNKHTERSDFQES